MVENISLHNSKIQEYRESDKKKCHSDKKCHNKESVFNKPDDNQIKNYQNAENINNNYAKSDSSSNTESLLKNADPTNYTNTATEPKPEINNFNQTNQTPQTNTTQNPAANVPQTQVLSDILNMLMSMLQTLKMMPTQNPTFNPMQQPMMNPMQQPMMNPMQAPIFNPMQPPMMNPIQPPIANPVPYPVANTFQNPTTKPAQSPTINTTASIPTSNKPVGAQDTGSDPIIQAQGRNIFVDSVNGSDSNDGSSPERAYKTLSKVSGANLQPGDVVNLARGSEFNGGLRITSSGTEDMPITFRAYGSGERPEISNSGYYSTSVSLENADHIILDGLKATGAMEDGFGIKKGSEYNIIRNCEATDVGIGIALRGENNVATQNYIHDLKLVVNTPGGDDDYGAVGAWLFASNNEISYNKMENLLGQSYDYGMDGGGCEVTGDVSNCKIIGNEITNTNGFMEFSQGTAQGVAANNIIADNIVKDFGDVFTCIHTGSHFGINVRNLQVTNNTIINSADKLNNLDNLFNYDGPKLSDSEYILKDNKFIAD